MPLDRKDSGATWQGPHPYKITEVSPDAPWEPADEDAAPLPQEEPEPQTDSKETTGLHLGADADDEAEETPTSDRAEIMSQLGYYSLLIITPLLFAAFTALLVLPFVATGHAKLPAQTTIPLAVIILIIALAQGVAIYYTGTTNGLWAIYTLVGFFLFVLVGCFALSGPVVGILVFLLFLGLAIFLARRYVHPVAEGYVDIVRAFGKYSRTLYPGFNFLLPWETVTNHLSTTETIWKTPVQRVQMARDEDVVLRGTITYQLLPEDAHLAATSVKNWEEGLHELFIAALQNIAATFTPEDFIAWSQGMHTRPTHGSAMPLTEGEPRWEQVNGLVFQRIRDRVALWGVLVEEVRLYDIALAPHEVTSLLAENTAPVARKPSAAPPPRQASKPVVTAQSAQKQAPVVPVVPSAQPTKPDVAVPKGLKEDILRKAYAEVKNGKIKDPETIRSLATQFDTVAKSPELSQSFTFDAARAAANLYEEAERREEEEGISAGTLFTDETKTDWNIRRPANNSTIAE